MRHLWRWTVYPWVLVLLPACGEPAVPGPDVLLISVDTTRADRLGCYGFEGIETPHIDALARGGALFTQATSTAPITLPAHTSMMTAMEPYRHGVRNNGTPLTVPGSIAEAAGSGGTLLAERLRAAGYRTGAFVSAFVLDARFGLDRGFDVYDDEFGAAGGPSAPDSLSRPAFERRADATAEAALRFLRDGEGQPQFAWAHFYDPHDPYEPPEPFRSRYEDPYLAEVAFMDQEVGRLIDAARELAGERGVLVALVGDHGEGLFDHGEETHTCFLYDSVMSVPLILAGAGRVPAGVRIDEQVSIIDLAPTLLELLQLEIPGAMAGNSAAPLLLDREGEWREPGSAYCETMIPRYDMGFSHLRALRRAGWKYIHAPRPELYNISEDPGETRNLADERQDLVENMQRRLRQRLEDLPVLEQVGSGADAETRERLMSLGYLGGSETAEPGSEMDLFEPVGDDPKDHVREVNLVKKGFELMRDRAFPAARASFEEAAGLHEGWWVPRKLVAMTWLAEGRADRAMPILTEVVELAPDDVDTLFRLASLEDGQGRRNQAEQRMARIVSLDPGHVQARGFLARAALRRGESAKVIEHCLAVLAVQADDTSSMTLLAWVLATAPDDELRSGDEALTLARRACDATGNRNVRALLSLAAAYAEKGMFDAARKTAGRAGELARGQNDQAMMRRATMLLEQYFREDRAFRDVKGE